MEALWVGEGSIRQIQAGREKGRWRLQWICVVGGQKKKVDKTFSLKAEALKWRDEKKVELKTGFRKEAVRSRTAANLQSVFDEFAGKKENGYLDGKWVQDGASPLTVATAAYRWGKWVEGTDTAKVHVRSLNRDHARAHVRAMKENGAPVQTIVDVTGVLKKVVNGAIRERPDCRDLLNPFVGLSIESNHEKALRLKARGEKEAAEGGKLVTLAPLAAATAIRQAESLSHKALLGVHLLSGLRLGEQMALCAEQVDFARSVIVVDRAVHLTPTGGQYVGLPKGNKIRLVAMCPTLAAILKAHIETLPPGRQHLFGADREDKPRMKDKTYDLWREAVGSAQLPPALVPKGCRVSHNNWIEKLMPKVSLSTRLEHLGHSLAGSEGAPKGSSVNIRNYTAHIPEAYAVLRKEMERLLRDSHLRARAS
jgi:integrase